MDWLPERLRRLREFAYAAAAAPYLGISTDGRPRQGLFAREPTGVPTEPIRAAAEAYLATLDARQRQAAQLPIDAAEWRTWSNISPFVMRHGMLLDDLSEVQRSAALGIVAESLSASGFQTTRDVMRLNDSLAELTGATDEYGEFVYWLTIFGTPSDDRPWGWQLDGHHCNLNCFVLGDQLVLTPAFLGSEPVYADTGKHAGTRVFEAEERGGLELVRSLSPGQQAQAILFGPHNLVDLPPGRFRPLDGHIQGGAARDTFHLAFEGIRFDQLDLAQQQALLGLVQVYAGRLRPGHDQVKLDEVRRHVEETYFLWFGGIDETSVFYYRIHSPVVLIEFDHQCGIVFDNDTPSRIHVHTVVRTPNGNDYGNDLLRQHYERQH